MDIGSRSVKLLQLSADRSRLLEAARWDLPASFDELSVDARWDQIAESLVRAREGRRFRGRAAVLCLHHDHLFVQNLRLPRHTGGDLDAAVEQESRSRLPFPADEAHIQFLEAGDVRQSDSALREVIVVACHQPVLRRLLDAVEDAGLRPVSVDIEPAAIVRSYALQFNRDEDYDGRVMFVHVGYSNSIVIIAHGRHILFVKYVQTGGKHMDQAVADRLRMSGAEAAALRRHNGDRRRELQDPEVAHGISLATRPVLEKLANEIALCSRYHSVTFRGQPVSRTILSGGEASELLSESLQNRLNVPCLMSEPLRRYSVDRRIHPLSQWDIAVGLAARDTNRSKGNRSRA